MSDARGHRSRRLGHAWSWAAALGLGVGMASATSCLGANAGHCVYSGGDLACGSAICVLASRGGEASGVGDDGCFDGAEAPAGFLHAQYGLPARLDAAEGDPMDLGSVEGLLRRLADGDRSVGASDLARFEGSLVDEVVRVRGVFTTERGAAKASRDLDDADEQAIEDYYAEIEAWLAEQPPGTGTQGDTETTGDTEDTTATSTGDTSQPGCVMNADCVEAGLPFCGAEQECVTCEGMPDPNGACASVDADVPLCVGGACVQCTEGDAAACTGTTPVCDVESNTCVGCTAHEQCGDAACNLYTGACLPGDAVVHVGPGQDFATLGGAVASFAEGAEGTIVVHADDYNEAVTVDAGRVLAFVAAEVGPGVEPPRWIRSSGSTPQLTVSAETTVLLDGLQLSGNASSMVPGLLVDGGRAWVDRGRIVTNLGGGIVAQAGAELTLRNCFLGGEINNVDAIAINAASLNMLYSTAGGGAATSGRARALYCEGGDATVRNSIFVSFDPMPEVECPGVTLTNSATEADVGNLMSTWFMSYATGDFHLSASGATTFEGIAQWQPGDPLTDIDGDPRPQLDGAEDYAGADVP